MKEKANKIHLHPLTIHIHIATYDYDAIILMNNGNNDVLQRAPTFNILKYFYYNFD
jgi:hypothetical protein